MRKSSHEIALYVGLLLAAACTDAAGKPVAHDAAVSGDAAAADAGGRANDAADAADAGDAARGANGPDAASAHVDADAGRDADVDAGPPPAPPPLLAFGPPSGTFVDPIQIELTANPKQAKLYYTLDGTYPSDSSTRYTGPVAVSATTLLRVAIYDAGTLLGTRDASYVALSQKMMAFDSNLPLVIVHMLAGTAPDPNVDTSVPAVMQIHDRGEVSGRASLLASANTDNRISIKVRGRSTRYQDKHSYTLELLDAYDDDDEQAQLLDLPPQSDWVLYAPYTIDRSLVRDAFLMQLSNEIGRYAPRTRFVEAFMATQGGVVDDSSYLGVYVVTEKIKRDPARVDVQLLGESVVTEPLLTGGYIVRIDTPDMGEKSFAATGVPSPDGQAVEPVYPSSDKINASQLAYLSDYVNAVGRALLATDHVDPTTQLAAEDLIDVNAFIDHHILNLLAKNPDGLRLSAYMFKPRGGPLSAGPIWDCDRCMGANDSRQTDPNGWDGNGDSTRYFTHGFWAGFFADTAFYDRYWNRWHDLLAGPFKAAKLDASIDKMANELDEAAARNAARWPEAAPINNQFRDEIGVLETWLAARLTFASANLRTP